MFSKAKARGFTLIELLVVIAIIGILASIIIVSLGSAKAQGRDAKRISDLRNISLGLETYYNDNGHYPCDIYSNPGASACQPAFFGTYMSVVPKDPSGNTPYKYAALSTANTAVCNFYHLGAVLETATNPGLQQDNDLGIGTYPTCTSSTNPAFEGNSNNCGTSVSSPDNCYDVTP